MIRSESKFAERAKNEAKTLALASKANAKSATQQLPRSILEYLGEFQHEDHTCIVTELAGESLERMLKKSPYGISLPSLSCMAGQLLSALATLEELKIVHADVKPPNILLADGHTSSIKLADFSSAHLANEHTFDYAQTRLYRAPEVAMGIDSCTTPAIE